MTATRLRAAADRLAGAAGALLLAIGALLWLSTPAGAQAHPARLPAGGGPAPGSQAAGAAIVGKVVNGTAGAGIAPGLVVTLRGYDDFNVAQTLTSTVGPAGDFSFADVQNAAGRYFLVSTEYQGVPYSSDLLKFAPGGATLETSLRVYEATSDPGALRVAQLHVVFDEASDGVTANEVCLISNSGDHTFVPGSAGLALPLPAGAGSVAIQSQRSGANVTLGSGSLAIRSPLQPGSGTVEVSFTFRLPAGRPVAFQQAMPFPVDGITVFVPDGGATAEGGDLQPAGRQVVQGKPYQSYGGTRAGPAGTISFKIQGAGGANPQWLGDPNALIVVGLGLLNVVLLAAIAALLWRRRAGRPARPSPSSQPSRAEQPHASD